MSSLLKRRPSAQEQRHIKPGTAASGPGQTWRPKSLDFNPEDLSTLPRLSKSPLEASKDWVNSSCAVDTSTRLSHGESTCAEGQDVSDNPNDIWSCSQPVPGSKQKKVIFPNLPVELAGIWSREDCRRESDLVISQLQALVDRHLDLRELEKRPVYCPRMVGTEPETARPSIVIICRYTDATALRDLFCSKAGSTLRISNNSSMDLRSLWEMASGKQRRKDHTGPRLSLVYYRTSSATMSRNASKDPLEAYTGEGLGYCGGLLKHREASATLGPSIIIDNMVVMLTVGHLFNSKCHSNDHLNNQEKSPSNLLEPSSGEANTWSVTCWWDDDDDEYSDLDERDLKESFEDIASLASQGRASTSLEEKTIDSSVQRPELWEKVPLLKEPSSGSPYLDWAVVRPQSPLFLDESLINTVPKGDLSGNRIRLDSIRQTPPNHFASVYMVSGVRGCLRGKILAGSSYIPSSQGQPYSQVWSMILDNSASVRDGECGSVVVDGVTHEVYGHVIGSDPFGHAYVTPLSHVLGQIKSCFRATRVELTPKNARGQVQRQGVTDDPQDLDPRQHSTMSIRYQMLPVEDVPTVIPQSEMEPSWSKSDPGSTFNNYGGALNSTVRHETGSESPYLLPPKRPKTNHEILDDKPEKENEPSTRRGRALRHEDYTIAWICALPVEMAAARVVLDEVHGTLSRDLHDSNVYVMGSIKQHNVVIACLPSDKYGPRNAAGVVRNLFQTFPSIDISLMVGIGGGVPAIADLRLGDVVVGIKVMRSESGTFSGHDFQRTAVARFPPSKLSTLALNLRSKLELDSGRLPARMREKFGRFPEYARPNLDDLLFRPTCEHSSSRAPACDLCDMTQQVPRMIRESKEPEIHYGAIASANASMENAIHRDRIGEQLGIMCFETEASEVVDTFPCLLVRGISDYADSHKEKMWQRYAAATAATYARELLQERPVPGACRRVAPSRDTQESSRKHLLEPRVFDDANARGKAIKETHAETCT